MVYNVVLVLWSYPFTDKDLCITNDNQPLTSWEEILYYFVLCMVYLFIHLFYLSTS